MSMITKGSPSETWKFGTQERVARGTPIALKASVTAVAGARRYTTMRAFRASAGYQVTAGKTLIITRLIYAADTASVWWHFEDGTDDIGQNSATAPASAVNNDGSITLDGDNSLNATTAVTTYERDYYMEVPAGRYLAVTHTNGNVLLRVHAFGVEI